MQKQKIKREYAKAVRKGGAATREKSGGKHPQGCKENRRGNKKAALFVARHPVGVLIAIAALLLFIIIFAGAVLLFLYVFRRGQRRCGDFLHVEDSDLVAVENNYAAMENELQAEIDNIESTHPGYDEYRYDLDAIGHNPHELASYLTALLQSYTPQSAQAEIERIFDMPIHPHADRGSGGTLPHRNEDGQRGQQLHRRGTLQLLYPQRQAGNPPDHVPCAGAVKRRAA